MKIGVFDSGIGGVTVLGSLKKRFPELAFSYFGDTANVPYGTKSPAQIRNLCERATEQMKSRGLDLLVVACNTASSLALNEMKRGMGATPVIGVVEAGVQSVREARSEGERVLILGTKATVKSGIYGKLLRETGNTVQVLEQACPLLVPLIEEGWVDHPVLHQTIAEYVKPYVSGEPGVALLACTHYPWIREAVGRALPGWKIIDSAQAVVSTIAPLIAPLSRVGARAEATIEWNFSDPDAVASFIFEGDRPVMGRF